MCNVAFPQATWDLGHPANRQP